jgi:glycosyltransferase involved in cell wall biosynthesis
MDPRPSQARLCYFALDVPHRGQASFIHITEMVENLRKRGWRLDVLMPAPGPDGRGPPLIGRLFAHARLIVRTIRRLTDYDAIYMRAHFLAWPVTFAARRKGLVIVQEVNGPYADVVVSNPWLRPAERAIAWLYRWQYRHSDHILPVTSELAESLRREGIERPITVIPNAANTDLFRPIATTPGRPFVAFFGGLTVWHGVDLMLAAMRHPAWPSGVELVVIGTGAKRAEVAAAQEAGEPVRWLGYRPNSEIPQLIAGALAGLVPNTNPSGRSSTGILPLKLYETLACGIPAIVTELPGQADLVRDGKCGLVIAPDAGALARAVAYLQANADEARAMGQRGAELVASRHSWAARAADVDATLADHLRHRPSAQTRELGLSRRSVE